MTTLLETTGMREVDVFTGPHSRMKYLVHLYSEKLSSTDFTSYADLKALLLSLVSTFSEFKNHEHIENKCIMQKLQNRLNFLHVEVTAVNQVHSDNHLSEMKDMLEDLYKKVDMCLSQIEMEQMGKEVQQALQEFTQDFLPHMKEEEEVFQPLLIEYFTMDELMEIKTDVMELHSQLTKYDPYEKVFSEHEQDEFEQSKLLAVPDEVMLQVFSYLSPKELCRSSQVCSRWSNLAKDGSLWKHINPMDWAMGDWRFEQPNEEEEICGCNKDVPEYYDEDKDYDESGESDESQSRPTPDYVLAIEKESKMLRSIARHLLPVVGSSVETLLLANSCGITSSLLYKMLSNCPNLKILNVCHTRVSDVAFRGLGDGGLGCKLEHLNLAGCVRITDITLVNLAKALSKRVVQPTHSLTDVNNDEHNLILDKNGVPKCSCNSDYQEGPPDAQRPNDVDISNKHGNDSHVKSTTDPRIFSVEVNIHQSKKFAGPGDDHYRCATTKINKKQCGTKNVQYNETQINARITFRYLNLSGCHQITDAGLRTLAKAGPLPRLQHLDLSGCLNVTADGLTELTNATKNLDHEQFFYCDNIHGGPHEDTASGCQNLQSDCRVCCRSGE
ncbi:F-box/LRR-repeat protein 5-like [Anneissia japonica]|uniref:F-box/LRR-repeat protein 5-like n=1 Tax=Anneissia japonica TaxID=1529436 RepID=UPI00142562DA|nr:F-box/LRR-repeat protein 5-like [Anneissia japonica]XP_033123446.1 F-box/LRR-repeat protein 5-like [Anneissia japonica]